MELAKAVGVSRVSVARWENGWVIPTLFYAKRLAEVFGITVEELMMGEQSNKSETEVFKPNTAAVARFSVLTFVPVVMYCIIYSVIYALDRHFAMSDIHRINDIVFHAAYNAAAALGYLIFGVMLAFWVIRLISEFKSAPDNYLRYELYRKWNIGLVFLMINLFALMLRMFTEFFVLLPYAYAIIISVILDFTIDTIIKKACDSRLTVPQNHTRKILNIVFVSVTSAFLVTSLIGGLFLFVLHNEFWIIGVYLMIISGIAALGVALTYMIIRTVLSAKDK